MFTRSSRSGLELIDGDISQLSKARRLTSNRQWAPDECIPRYIVFTHVINVITPWFSLKKKTFFTNVAVNFQGLFARWLLDNKRPFHHLHPRRPPESVGDSDPAKKKKNANSPQFIEGSAHCASCELLCHGYKRSFTFLSARSPLTIMPMHTSQTSRGLDAGDVFLSRKIPTTILQAARLNPALIRTGKVLWRVHTRSTGMSVCTRMRQTRQVTNVTSSSWQMCVGSGAPTTLLWWNTKPPIRWHRAWGAAQVWKHIGGVKQLPKAEIFRIRVKYHVTSESQFVIMTTKTLRTLLYHKKIFFWNSVQWQRGIWWSFYQSIIILISFMDFALDSCRVWTFFWSRKAPRIRTNSQYRRLKSILLRH